MLSTVISSLFFSSLLLEIIKWIINKRKKKIKRYYKMLIMQWKRDGHYLVNIASVWLRLASSTITWPLCAVHDWFDLLRPEHSEKKDEKLVFLLLVSHFTHMMYTFWIGTNSGTCTKNISFSRSRRPVAVHYIIACTFTLI